MNQAQALAAHLSPRPTRNSLLFWTGDKFAMGLENAVHGNRVQRQTHCPEQARGKSIKCTFILFCRFKGLGLVLLAAVVAPSIFLPFQIQI